MLKKYFVFVLIFIASAIFFNCSNPNIVTTNNVNTQENSNTSLDDNNVMKSALEPNGDFREETIYFLIPPRFYDGDTSNNVHCWDDAQAKNPDTDPAWRGDFNGLIKKLD